MHHDPNPSLARLVASASSRVVLVALQQSRMNAHNVCSAAKRWMHPLTDSDSMISSCWICRSLEYAVVNLQEMFSNLHDMLQRGARATHGDMHSVKLLGDNPRSLLQLLYRVVALADIR